MHSENAARAVLSRRNFFAAGAALAAGSVFSFSAKPSPADLWGIYLEIMAKVHAAQAVNMRHWMAAIVQVPEISLFDSETDERYRARVHQAFLGGCKEALPQCL